VGRLLALVEEAMIRICVRGWKAGVLAFEERLEMRDVAEMERLLPAIAERQIERLLSAPCLIEIEFLDEPDVNQRFFRFGTDPTRMARPLAIDLNRLPD
jgi:hypothetical protein